MPKADVWVAPQRRHNDQALHQLPSVWQQQIDSSAGFADSSLHGRPQPAVHRWRSRPGTSMTHGSLPDVTATCATWQRGTTASAFDQHTIAMRRQLASSATTSMLLCRTPRGGPSNFAAPRASGVGTATTTTSRARNWLGKRCIAQQAANSLMCGFAGKLTARSWRPETAPVLGSPTGLDQAVAAEAQSLAADRLASLPSMLCRAASGELFLVELRCA